jgi:hypothetical protein
VHWYSLAGYVIIGCSMAAAMWIAEGIWHHALSPLDGGWDSGVRRFMRIPLWYVAGGAGYVAGMVVGKKIGAMGFYDIPIRPLFHTGARLGTILQLAFVLFIKERVVKPSNPAVTGI